MRPTGSGVRSAFLRLGPIGLTIFLQTAWVAGFYLRGDVASLARKDWRAFYDAGCRLLSGDLAAIYPGATLIPQPWLYPPYCIWFTAPLGLLSPGWAYIACVSTQIVAVLASYALAAVMTAVVLKVVDAIVGLRVAEEDEVAGLDLSQHSETAYVLVGGSYSEFSGGGGAFNEAMRAAEAKTRVAH